MIYFAGYVFKQHEHLAENCMPTLRCNAAAAPPRATFRCLTCVGLYRVHRAFVCPVGLWGCPVCAIPESNPSPHPYFFSFQAASVGYSLPPSQQHTICSCAEVLRGLGQASLTRTAPPGALPPSPLLQREASGYESGPTLRNTLLLLAHGYGFGVEVYSRPHSQWVHHWHCCHCCCYCCQRCCCWHRLVWAYCMRT